MDLATELRRLDLLIHRQILRLRAAYEASLDEFRGLYISDAHVDALLAAKARTTDHPDVSALVSEAVRLESDAGPVARLAAKLGLDRFERDVLLLALAPELDLRYETLIAYLNNDVTRKWPTVDLALRLFVDDPAARPRFQARLTPGAPLFTTGALEPVADDARRSSLAGAFGAAPCLARWIHQQPLDDPLLADCMDCHLPRPGCTSAPPVPDDALLVVVGPYGAGADAVVDALCRARGAPHRAVDAEALLDGPTAPRRIARLGSIARLQPGPLRLHGLGPAVLSDATRRRALNGLLDRLQAHGPVVLEVEPDAAWRPVLRGRRFIERRLPMPAPDARRIAWQAALRAEGLADTEGAVAHLAERFRLRPGQIVDAAREAAVHHAAGDADAHLLARSTQRQLRRDLGSLARRIQPAVGLDGLVLPDRTAGRVRAFIGAVKHRNRVFESWGFGRNGRPGGLATLFVGPSGTGKTLAAEAVAHATGLDLYHLDLSGVVSKYIGETEKNLDRIFNAAHSANAILFFDEADALFGKRSEVSDAHDRYANIEVAYLLQKLEAHDGVVILATNLSKNIDQAFSRRMHLVLDFPRPGPELRLRLWRLAFPANAPVSDDLDLDFLARQFDLTGGDIRTIALDAAFSSATAGGLIDMSTLLHAVARQLHKQGRPATANQFKQYHPVLTAAS